MIIKIKGLPEYNLIGSIFELEQLDHGTFYKPGGEYSEKVAMVLRLQGYILGRYGTRVTVEECI